MIPFRDNIRSRTYPYVTVGLIALNAMVFLLQVMLAEPAGTNAVFQFGFTPARVGASVAGQDEWTAVIRTAVQTRSGVRIFERPLLLPAGPGWVVLTLFTSMFMHGGWMHIISNMLFLWIFGDNIEDRFGHVPYVFFYLFSGVCAAGMQTLLNWGSRVPMVGASGAIAGVLGAYLIAYPRARILTVLPIFFFLQFVEVPAFIMLGLWFVIQFFNGVASISQVHAGGVAHWAHIGGFAAGLLIMLGLRKIERDRARRRARQIEVILPGEDRYRPPWPQDPPD